MKVKVFDKNDKGKIEFTRKELEALLNEVYNDGHSEGHSKGYKEGYDAGKNTNTYTWTSPSITSPSNIPYYYTTTTSSTDGVTYAYLNNENCERVYYGIEDDDYTDGQLSLNLTMVK